MSKFYEHVALTHKASREVTVSANLAIDLDQTLHGDLHDLSVGKSILEAVTQQDDKWQTLP